MLIVLAAEAAALILGFALLTGHGAWLAVRQHRLAPRVAAARAGIVQGIVEHPDDALPITLLAGLPFADRLRIIGDAAPSVGGAQRIQLRELARRAGILDRAGRMCRSRRWKRRLRGARIHTLLGSGEHDVPRLFGDRHADVRAEAAAWGAEHPEPAIVAHLLELLTDEATICRFTVKDSLLRLGPTTVEPLRDFLASANGAPAAAALEVAAALRDPRLLDPAYRLLGDGDATTRRRATDLLGALGGERALTALIACLHDDAGEVRAAAARALGHGQHWTAAGELAGALRDTTWDVRRAAGTALLGLGPAGELLLRRMLTDEDPFAGDMAQLMLDLPRSRA